MTTQSERHTHIAPSGLAPVDAARKIEMAREICALISEAILAERERCARFADAWDSPSALRLAAGEMTAQEMRTARAVARGIAAAIRDYPHLPSGAAACAADSPAGSTSSPIPSGTNQPEPATQSTEQPTSAAEVTTPDANTHGQTGAADISGLAASVPASRKAVAKTVGQSGQIAAVELPVDTLPRADAGADITMTHEGIRT